MTQEKVRSETRIQVMDRKKVLRSHKRYWFFRRGQDILFSGMALIVLNPILLITALAVWVDDPTREPNFQATTVW